MSNEAFSRKEVRFGGPNASKNFQGVHFSPNPKNWAGYMQGFPAETKV
jgi:hypothetical protein